MIRDKIEVFKLLNGYENTDRNIFLTVKEVITRGHEDITRGHGDITRGHGDITRGHGIT